LVEGEALRGLEIGGNPVHDAVAHEVDERVGDRNRPQVAIAQHVLDENFAIGEGAARVVRVIGRIVVLVGLDRRQAVRLRRVAQKEERDDRHDRGNSCVEVQLGAPVVKQRDARHREGGHQAAADVVAHVPERHDQPRSLVLNQCTIVLPHGGQPMPCTQPLRSAGG
jgi:hypothetical protein